MDEAVECLKAVLKLIEDGDLVRNTRNDSDVQLYLAQGVLIVTTLKRAQEIVEAWTKTKEVIP